jgi:DNA polymerase
MDSMDTYWADRAALEWQLEAGVTEAMLDAPLNRYDVPDTVAKPSVAAPGGPPPAPVVVTVDGVTEARKAAQNAGDLAMLQTAVRGFAHCDLKRGARNLVFAEGDAAARVMIIGEAPDRDADRAGIPFAGDGRALLDKMLAAINLGVAHDNIEHRAYLTAAFPWSAGHASPTADDIALLRPFLERHITLADPDIVILMGNTPCQMLLGKAGVSRMRGQWVQVLGRPAMPMLHPAQLLQTPLAKRDAWADLLAVQARLRG